MSSVGIYEKALISKDLEHSLSYAKQLGYDFWEISVDNERKHRLTWNDDEINNLLEICQKTNMPIFNMVLSVHRDFPLGSHNDTIRQQGIEYLYQAIDLSRKLGIRTIQLAGYYTQNNYDDGSIERYIEALKNTIGYAASNGILLGIENMDRDLLNTKDILYIVESVNSPYLKVFLDVGNFAANGLDPIKELEPALPHLVGLHLKETKLGEYRRVRFGEGIVNFKDIFDFLKQNKYEGYFGVEMWNDENLDSLHEIDYSLKWLEEKYKVLN